MPRKRLETTLSGAGAEHLVIGQMLIDGIHAYRAYLNQAAFDVLAVWPEGNTSCRIQVKSRWATDSNMSFPISKYDCDFVVFVLLNRGVRYRKARVDEEVQRVPDFYVVPIAVVSEHVTRGRMSVLKLRQVPDYTMHLGAWGQVRDFLGVPAASV